MLSKTAYIGVHWFGVVLSLLVNVEGLSKGFGISVSNHYK